MKESLINFLSGSASFFEVLIGASMLPLLAVIALLLRREIFKGKVKKVVFVLGFVLLGYVIFDHIIHHDMHFEDYFIMLSFAFVTYIILSFAHKHYHEKDNVKGIAIAEFVHSLLDGAVIGAAYLINPILGWGALLAILTHEAPKILGTVFVIRSLTTNNIEAFKYSLISQAGVPLMAVFVYVFGHNIAEINPEFSHFIELASIATLITILMRVAYHSIKHRGHDHIDCEEEHDKSKTDKVLKANSVCNCTDHPHEH